MTDNPTTTISQLEKRILGRIKPIMFVHHHGQYEAVKYELSELCRIAKEVIDDNAIIKTGGMTTLTFEDVIRRGRQLCNRYGLPHWRMEIDTRSKNRNGTCRYGSETIAISAKFISDVNMQCVWEANAMIAETYDRVAELDNLLLHEIAHGLTQCEKVHHGIEWARRYCELVRCHFSPDRSEECIRNESRLYKIFKTTAFRGCCEAV